MAIKTRLEILEEMYNDAHAQKIGQEFLYEGLQSKIIVLIKPDELGMRDQLEQKKAIVKNMIQNHEHAMKRIMDKIKEEEKNVIHLESNK